ncbi:MAG: LPS assembly lipoprotein LptE [Balneolaceae bacterium]|nr:LPS assembly lipoprotein LptE [Balneolaceae bacterium]
MKAMRNRMARFGGMGYRHMLIGSALVVAMALPGCINYSFTGTSIPSEVETLFIPFFDDRSGSGIGSLNQWLYDECFNEFINRSRLRLANTPDEADATLEGVLLSYTNLPFSVSGEETAERNEVTIRVQATMRYDGEDEPVFSATLTGSSTFDIVNNPIDGEREAAQEALNQIAEAMFTQSVSQW